MDPLTMLAEAKRAGLTVFVDGERLVVRGPKTAEDLARQLLDHKAKLIAHLAETPACPKCQGPTHRPEVTAPGISDVVLCDDREACRWASYTDPSEETAAGPAYLVKPQIIDGDAHLWRELILLTFADDQASDLYSALVGLCDLGARLERIGDTCKLSAGRMDPAEYRVIRDRWLRPHQDQLTRLLRLVGRPLCAAIESPNEKCPAPWWQAFAGELSEERHAAVVDADIQRHGYYTASRRYPEPAEDPRLIWRRRGLAEAGQPLPVEGVWF